MRRLVLLVLVASMVAACGGIPQSTGRTATQASTVQEPTAAGASAAPTAITTPRATSTLAIAPDETPPVAATEVVGPEDPGSTAPTEVGPGPTAAPTRLVATPSPASTAATNAAAPRSGGKASFVAGRAYGIGAMTLASGAAPDPEVRLPPAGGDVSDSAPSTKMGVQGAEQQLTATGRVDVHATGSLRDGTAGASVTIRDVGMEGLVTAKRVRASSESRCGPRGPESEGRATVEGMRMFDVAKNRMVPVAVTGEPNQTIRIELPGSGGLSTVLVINRQVGGEGNLGVQGVYLTYEMGGQPTLQDTVIGSAKSAVACRTEKGARGDRVTKTFELTLYGDVPRDQAFTVQHQTEEELGEDGGGRLVWLCGQPPKGMPRDQITIVSSEDCRGGEGTVYTHKAEFERGEYVRVGFARMSEAGMESEGGFGVVADTGLVELELLHADGTSSAWYDSDTKRGGEGDRP